MSQEEFNAVMDGTACFETMYQSGDHEFVVVFLNKEGIAFCPLK